MSTKESSRAKAGTKNKPMDGNPAHTTNSDGLTELKTITGNGGNEASKANNEIIRGNEIIGNNENRIRVGVTVNPQQEELNGVTPDGESPPTRSTGTASIGDSVPECSEIAMKNSSLGKSDTETTSSPAMTNSTTSGSAGEPNSRTPGDASKSLEETLTRSPDDTSKSSGDTTLKSKSNSLQDLKTGDEEAKSREPLERNSSRESLYSKIAQSMIPPLTYFGLTPTTPREEAHDYFDDVKKKDDTHNDVSRAKEEGDDKASLNDSDNASRIFDKRASTSTLTDDEVDAAAPLGEIKPLNYFINLISAASAHAGLPGAKLRKLICDNEEVKQTASRIQKAPSSPQKSLLRNLPKLQVPFYGIYESESESETDEESIASDGESMDTFHTTVSHDRRVDGYDESLGEIQEGGETVTSENEGEIGSEGKDNKRGTHNEPMATESEIGTESETAIESVGEDVNGENLREHFENSLEEGSKEFGTSDALTTPDPHETSDQDTSTLQETTARSFRSFSSDDTFPEHVTPFQQSVMDNLNPDQMSEGLLMKLKEGGNGELDDQARKKLRLRIARKLQRVFELDDNDHFYGNYSAWLIKDVLLQGHLYLTRDCIFFFAFLPKRYAASTDRANSAGHSITNDDSDVTIQCGALGLKTAKYVETVFSTVITHRFWAILRPQTLSIYSSSTDLYFPNVVIELKSCIKAEVLEKDKEPTFGTSGATSPRTSGTMTPRTPGTMTPRTPGALSPRGRTSETFDESSDSSSVLATTDAADAEDTENLAGGCWFKLTTRHKTYKFHTDNLFSAREWCHNLTKIIFQLNNSNPSNEVLLKIPMDNVLDFERNTLFEHGHHEEEEVEIIRGSDSEDEDDDEADQEDTPMTLCVHSRVDNEMGQRVLSRQKFKKRMKKGAADMTGRSQLLVESNYFVFFAEGEVFYQSLQDVFAKKQSASEQRSMTSVLSSNRFLTRARRMVGRDATQVAKHSGGISTLAPSIQQGSILRQISELNQHLRSAFEWDALENMETSTPSVESRLKKIGNSITHPTKIFKRSLSQTDIPSLDEMISEDPHTGPKTINLPRPMTVEGLKSLKITFETSRKDIAVAERRFKEIQGTIGDPEKYISQSLLMSTSDSESIIPGPLTLSDPSEHDDSDNKKNKLTSLKKNIKAFSNVGSMWNAAPSHFVMNENDDRYYVKNLATREVAESHFRSHFSFTEEKTLAATYYAHLQRAIPVYGKVYVGNEDICFRSLLPGVATKMILPLKNVDDCYASKCSKLAYCTLCIVVSGGEEILLEFSSQLSREDCTTMILRQLEIFHAGELYISDTVSWKETSVQQESSPVRLYKNRVSQESNEADLKLAQARIEAARTKMFEDKLLAASGLDIPIMLEDSPFFKTEIKPSTSYNFVLLTIGSRGDVQPYIALGKGLLKEGHNVTIATHIEFQEWIEKHGILFREIAGDPSELMSLMVSHGSMSVAFLKEASSKFRGWISDLLRTSWEACQGCDILIESPSAMGGVHIAEALGIPYMRAFTMPWTRTKAYPHAFIVPDQKKGSSYNYLTHVMFENVFWKGVSGQVNKWRVNTLGLPKTNLYRLLQHKIPFLYNISPTIFPASVDFPDWVKVTGYWFLNEGSADDYEPPKELVEFMVKAREDEKSIVYIGFGLIVVSDAKRLTKEIVDAVKRADVRCILNKGWSDRLTKNDEKNEPEIELPEEIYSSGSIPHDWLFTKIDAAVHHGGSGTTGATLRSGIPTIIKPFFGDQFFYASRVEDVGVGIGLKKLNAKSLSKAIVTAILDPKMIERAKKLSVQILHENGVAAAVEAIYTELEYARTLTVAKQKQNETYRYSNISGAQTPVVYEESEDEDEEDDYEDHKERAPERRPSSPEQYKALSLKLPV